MKKENYIIINSKKLSFEFWNHFDSTICAILTTYVSLAINKKVINTSAKDISTKEDIPNHIIKFKTKKEFEEHKDILLNLFSTFIKEISGEFNLVIV